MIKKGAWPFWQYKYLSRYLIPNFTFPHVDVSELSKNGQIANKKTPVPIINSNTSPSARCPQKPTAVANLLDFNPPADSYHEAKDNNLFPSSALAGLSLADFQEVRYFCCISFYKFRAQ